VAGGFLGAPVEFDGVTRRAWLLAVHEQAVYGALSLVMAQALWGNPVVRLRFAESLAASVGPRQLAAIELHAARGARQFAVDAQGSVLLPFRGAEGSFAHHSAAAVLAGRLPADRLRGRVVLLGTSAPGLVDQRSTPVSEAFPGVEVHANLLAGLLDDRLVEAPFYAPVLEASVLLIFGSTLLLVLPRLSPQWAVALSLLLMGLLAGISLAAWVIARLALPMAAGMCLLVALLGVHLFFGSFLEFRTRRHLAALFGQYVPPELVEEMSHDPENYSMQGRSAGVSLNLTPLPGNRSLPYAVAGMTGMAGSGKPLRAAAMTVARYCQAEAARRRQVSIRLASRAKAREPCSERVP